MREGRGALEGDKGRKKPPKGTRPASDRFYTNSLPKSGRFGPFWAKSRTRPTRAPERVGPGLGPKQAKTGQNAIKIGILAEN